LCLSAEENFDYAMRMAEEKDKEREEAMK